jgi:hypothetical protein
MRSNAAVMESRMGGPLSGGSRSWRDVGGLGAMQVAVGGGAVHQAFGPAARMLSPGGAAAHANFPWWETGYNAGGPLATVAGSGGGRSGGGGTFGLGGGAEYMPPGLPGGFGGGNGGGPNGPGGGGGWRGPGPGQFPSMGAPNAWLGHKVLDGAKWAAIAGAGVATDGLYEAGKLQQQMTLIQVATGANMAQRARLEQLAYTISDMTAQSVAQSAEVIGVMASSGINNPETLLAKNKQGQTFAEIVSKFADVQFLKTGGKTSFAEGSRELIQLAHLYRAYTPEQIAPIADTVSKLSFMMPDNLQRYLTQSSYFASTLGRLGVPQEETLVLGAFLDRMGLGRGKGGSAINNFVMSMMKPLKLTGHQQRGQGNALVDLGIYDAKGNPNPSIFKAATEADVKAGRSQHEGDSIIDVFAALKQIDRSITDQTKNLSGTARAKKERELITDFQKGFGVTGARFSLLGDQAGIAQLLMMVHQLDKAPGVEAGQSMFMKNMNSQGTRAWSNFQSLATEVGTQAIPGVTKAFKDMGDGLSYARSWLNKHGALEAHIQQVILDDVKGTEVWLVEHQKDFKDFGKDALDAFNALGKVGIALQVIADDAIIIDKVLHPLRTGQEIGDDWRKEFFNPDGSLKGENNAYTTADGHGGTLRLPKPTPPGPRVQHVKHTIEVKGAHNIANHVVEKTLYDILNSGYDPQHTAGRTGAIHTGPRQPTRNTTPNNPGG